MTVTWYAAVCLGLVQGFAEFLPISSSGHLRLCQTWLGIPDGGLLLTIILHLATLCAVVVAYWPRLWALIRHPWCREVWWLVLATAVTCGVVVVGHPWLDQLFTITALPWLLILSGVILWLPRIWCVRNRPPRAWQFVVLGLAQGVAVLPGLSRSGLTITAGQLCGQTQTQAADWSFLMSIPIIVASLVYAVWSGEPMVACHPGHLALAFVTAFVAGLVAIKWMLNLARKFDWRGFSCYLWLLGGGILLGRFLFHVGF